MILPLVQFSIIVTQTFSLLSMPAFLSGVHTNSAVFFSYLLNVDFVPSSCLIVSLLILSFLLFLNILFSLLEFLFTTYCLISILQYGLVNGFNDYYFYSLLLTIILFIELYNLYSCIYLFFITSITLYYCF